jgi:soluble lytic murein transglycosylase-like protein
MFSRGSCDPVTIESGLAILGEVPRKLISGRRARIALALLVLAAAAGTTALSDGSSPPPRPAALDPAPLPAPHQPLSRDPARLAGALTSTTVALRGAIERWLAEGNPSRGGPPDDVTLLALHQQRIYLLLTGRPRLAARTLGRLPAAVRAEARDTLSARRKLKRLAGPVIRRRRRFKTGPALPAGELLRLYRKAERRNGVAWNVLAAVNFVETGFNRLRSNSTAGAQGPMQFIPATWRAYGRGGDIHDPHDAILGAANYLRASGAPRQMRRALYSYNHSYLYVDAVQTYARRMRRDRRTFYALYSWQVFVRTPSGALRRLTGPGLR